MSWEEKMVQEVYREIRCHVESAVLSAYRVAGKQQHDKNKLLVAMCFDERAESLIDDLNEAVMGTIVQVIRETEGGAA